MNPKRHKALGTLYISIGWFPCAEKKRKTLLQVLKKDTKFFNLNVVGIILAPRHCEAWRHLTCFKFRETETDPKLLIFYFNFFFFELTFFWKFGKNMWTKKFKLTHFPAGQLVYLMGVSVDPTSLLLSKQQETPSLWRFLFWNYMFENWGVWEVPTMRKCPQGGGGHFPTLKKKNYLKGWIMYGGLSFKLN